MAHKSEVLGFLRPNGGYVQVGNDYEGIKFDQTCEPFTKEEYLAAFDEYDTWKAEKEAAKAAAKSAAEAKLAALGLTPADLKALGL